jgi:large subunit ribosomal protein L3
MHNIWYTVEMLKVYVPLQVGYHIVKETRIKKPELGHCNKAGTPPLRHLREFRVKDPAQLQGLEVGKEIALDTLFEKDQLVDIAGTTIGKGFQGTIKRWGHKRGLMSHGALRADQAASCCHRPKSSELGRSSVLKTDVA